jgi:hypothetical protein
MRDRSLSQFGSTVSQNTPDDSPTGPILDAGIVPPLHTGIRIKLVV